MNRAEAIEKYEGHQASPLRVCPACFNVDGCDRLDACSQKHAFNAIMSGGSACPECGHTSSVSFPEYGSQEAKREMIEMLEYVIKADAAHDRDKRTAQRIIDLIADEFEWVKQ